MTLATCGKQMSSDDIFLPSYDLRKELYNNRALIFKDVSFDENSFWNFSSKFGTPWNKEQYVKAKERDIIDLDDERSITLYHQKSYQRLMFTIDAHADVTNEPHSQPLPTRILYLLTLPEKFSGGETFLIDLIKAYKQYPVEVIEKYKNYEILYQSWQNVGTYRNWYKLVQYHPYTNEPFFLLNYCSQTVHYPWVIGFRDGNGDHHSINEVQELINLSQELNYSEISWKHNNMLVMDNIGMLHGRTMLNIDSSSINLRAMWRCTIEHNLEHNIKPIQQLDI